jgi:hypothetical protein
MLENRYASEKDYHIDYSKLNLPNLSLKVSKYALIRFEFKILSLRNCKLIDIIHIF